MNYPRGAAVDQDGVIYVVDANNCRVQVFNDNGTLRGVIGSIGSIGGSFATPQGIFIDSEGRVLVADTRNHRVQIFENFRLIAVLGEFGYEENQFCLPTACAAGSDGTIFVLDSKSKYGLVKIFDKDMKFKGSFAPNGDGPGELNDPQGMTIDDQGNLWVADTRNHRIQEFGSTGAFMSVWGGKEAGADRFLNPTGVARRGDRVYVADYGNKRIAMLRVSAG
jgi:DNA-binding beta-propeller fold protein YncE